MIILLFLMQAGENVNQKKSHPVAASEQNSADKSWQTRKIVLNLQEIVQVSFT
jgi:hypothetical protein